MIDNFISNRRKEKAKDSTIMRDLALLRRILNYHKVRDIPKFPKLAESAPREGFVEGEDFNLLRQQIKDTGVRTLATILYRYAFRTSELQNLLVRQINGRELKLYAGTTKNSRSRRVILDEGSIAEIQPLLKGKGPDDFVFTWQTGNKRGQQIKDYRRAWRKAKEAAKLTLTPHDMRRSAIRNMDRLGVSSLVARQISGHLTNAVFDRYNITSDKDLEEAAAKIGDATKSVPQQIGPQLVRKLG